jgi:hypothetical protein
LYSPQKSFDPPLPPRPLRQRTWFRFAQVAIVLLLFGAIRVPIEVRLNEEHRAAFFHGAKLNLSLREQIGQLAFLAALGGFRALVADGLWIQAHIDWTRTQWGKMLFLFNNVTALQPRNLMFWEMSAWHMAYNASAYAIQDTTQPRMALRLKNQHEYFLVGKGLLERGIENNPDRYNLYEALGTLLKDKLQDHLNASIQFQKASKFPDSPTYDERFAAYELSYCPGREQQAYEWLLRLYNMGEKERLPTLCTRLKYLQEELNIPESQRINIPDTMLPRRPPIANPQPKPAAQQPAQTTPPSPQH